MRTLSLSEARAGFRMNVLTRGRATRTAKWYDDLLGRFETYLVLHENPSLSAVTADDIRAFIVSLRETKNTHHGHGRPYSPFTTHGYTRALSAFFGWAETEGLVRKNPMALVGRMKKPESEKPRFQAEELEQLLVACGEYDKPLEARNKAIVLFLLDTGVRANELCTLTLDRLDPQLRRASVMGKGSVPREVPVGTIARGLLWKYIHVYRPSSDRHNEVFLTKYGGPFVVRELERMLAYLGERAGVGDCHPHKFRHTFARLFLMNGGDPWTLQQILGHRSMDTTRIYVRLESIDLATQHARASPGDRLGLKHV